MHVVITGASSGIGAGLAREYARVGASLTLVARRRELMNQLAAELGVRCHVVAADLSDPAQATAWLAAAESALGPVDVLINNAGVQIVAPTAGISLEDTRKLIELNLQTPLALIQAVLPAMLQRNSGAIVNVASMAALAPTPGMTAYNAAKGGLAAASESLRGELRKTAIRVVTVYPGPVHTPMGAAAYAAYPPALGPKLLPAGNTTTLARRIRRAVERRSARVIYPWIYTVLRSFPATTRVALDLSTPPPYALDAPERKKVLPRNPG